MASGNVYTAALMEHNAHPDYKYELIDFTHEHEGVNPSCGDEMVLRLRLSPDGSTIEEAAFTGSGLSSLSASFNFSRMEICCGQCCSHLPHPMHWEAKAGSFCRPMFRANSKRALPFFSSRYIRL